jgi:hypothetical protein
LSSGVLAAPSRAGEPEQLALERAIVQAVAYADVFDYPLTAAELHRYLVGVAASEPTLQAVLTRGNLVPSLLAHADGYYTLAGREAAIETRRTRAAVSATYWRRAVCYGNLLGALPFVRMVAVTGALAVDNIADGDIDYLIVTEPDRLWLCRAIVVGLVRVAALRGVTLCPNYFLSERALVLAEHNLFTAHEVTQMVPVSGLDTYHRLRELNRWTHAFLPNAHGVPKSLGSPSAFLGGLSTTPRSIAEAALRTRFGRGIEAWEMSRKVRKLGARGNGHVEAAFGPDWCKGHFGDHGQLTLARYQQRLAALEGRLQ